MALEVRSYYQLASGVVEQLWAGLRSVARAHLDNLDELAAAYLGAARALKRSVEVNSRNAFS